MSGPANDNVGLKQALEWTAKDVMANLLRVARGAGRIGSIRRHIDALSASHEVVSVALGEHIADDIVSDALSSWQDEYDTDGLSSGEADRARATRTINKGAMQVVASSLLNQRTQLISGETQIHEGIQELERLRRPARDTTPPLPVFAAPMRSTKDRSRVYFITDGVAIKIGVSEKPDLRLKGLQTSHHAPLSILGTADGGYSLEADLHGLFADSRLSGEWFSDSQALRDKISELCQATTNHEIAA